MKVSKAFANFMYYQQMNSGKKYGQELPAIFIQIQGQVR